jgi:hypothetical protein
VSVPERPVKEKPAAAAAPVRPPKKTTAAPAPAPERLPKKKTTAAAPELPRKEQKTAEAITAAAAAAVAPETPRKQKKKTVSFGNVVQLQEYSVTVGDHPKCKGSYPICLDWAHTEPKEYDLDAREKAKAIKAAREAKAAKAKEDKEDGGYGETKTKQRRVGKGRHLQAKERHLRIAKVTGTSQKEVRTLEVERLRQIHEAKHGPDLSRIAAAARFSKGKSLRGYREV